MYYKCINIPPVIEIGGGTAQKIDAILKDSHLYFARKILITSSELLEAYKNEINIEDFYNIVIVRGGTFEEISQINITDKLDNSLLVAFGGGSVIDFVKMYAQIYELPYITLPSTLSNDAIYSPIARLNKKGIKKSFGVKPPLGIIVDTDIIARSPKVLLLAGIGDLVSNLSAVKDWRLANKQVGETINNFALSLSFLSADSILSYVDYKIVSPDFIEQLSRGLILSGLAMVIADSSRPASGSEHLISHAIDELFPDRSTLHGLQVAYGQLLIEEYFRKDEAEYRRLRLFFEKMGLMNEIQNRIHFTEEERVTIFHRARTIRDRYTILNHFIEE